MSHTVMKYRRNYYLPYQIHRILNILEAARQVEIRNRMAKMVSTFIQNFSVSRLLGSGSFGVVYEVDKNFLVGNQYDTLEFDSNGGYGFIKKFAVKLLPNFDSTLGVTEIRNLSALLHLNVVKCYNAWDEQFSNTSSTQYKEIKKLLNNAEPPGYLYDSCAENRTNPDILQNCLFLQYELCNQGTLQDLLDSRIEQSSFRLEESRNLARQVVQGLEYLDFMGVIHGDLNPTNIFLTKREGKTVAKIGDFGLARRDVEVSYFIRVGGSSGRSESGGGMGDFRPRYHPPERCKGIYTCSGDIYSFGLIFLRLLGEFDSNQAASEAVLGAMNRDYPKYMESLPLECEWIVGMTKENEADRYRASDILGYMKQSNLYNPEEASSFRPLKHAEILKFITHFAESSAFRETFHYLCLLLDDIDAVDLTWAFTDEYIKRFFFAVYKLWSQMALYVERYREKYFREKRFYKALENLGLDFDRPSVFEFKTRFLETLELLLELDSELNATVRVELATEMATLDATLCNYNLSEVLNCKALVEWQWQRACTAVLKGDKGPLLASLSTLNSLLTQQVEVLNENDTLTYYNVCCTVILKANVLAKLARVPDAVCVYLQYISVFIDSCLGVEHNLTLKMIKGYAKLLFELGCYAEARPYIEAVCWAYARMNYIVELPYAYGLLTNVYTRLNLLKESFVVSKVFYNTAVQDMETLMVSVPYALHNKSTKEGFQHVTDKKVRRLGKVDLEELLKREKIAGKSTEFKIEDLNLPVRYRDKVGGIEVAGTYLNGNDCRIEVRNLADLLQEKVKTITIVLAESGMLKKL